MAGETFRFPCVITISRKTLKVTGIEYAELDAFQLCRFGERMARALENGKALQAAREAREAMDEGSEEDVTFSESAGAG